MRTVKARIMEWKIITPTSQWDTAFMEYRIRVPFDNVNGIKSWGEYKNLPVSFKNQAHIRRYHKKQCVHLGLVAYPKKEGG